ncbi:MAG: GNAT family N-acetyltransferase [Spirochaetales bacterium]|nr:GNAT family N-acetyltransferase [Spirochaetales bacterium]
MMFTIIKAKPDVKQLEDMIIVLESYMKDPMGAASSYTGIMKERLIRDLLQCSNLALFLGYSGSNIAGTAVCFIVYSTFLAKPALNIHDLAVLPDFRKKGLGRQLLQTVETFSLSENMGRITLEVRRDNTYARNLYQQMGYQAGNPPLDFWVKPL